MKHKLFLLMIIIVGLCTSCNSDEQKKDTLEISNSTTIYQNTLITIDKNTSIDLYKGYEDFGEGVKINKSVFVDKESIYIIYNDKRNDTTKILYEDYALNDSENPFNIGGLPIYDAVYDNNTGILRFIIRCDTDVFVYEVSIDNPKHKKHTLIYHVRWTPDLTVGYINDIRFIAPDIIRISNTTGTIEHIKITKDKDNNISKNIIWWNGKGSKAPISLMFQEDKDYNIGENEPYYDKDNLGDWIIMDKSKKNNYGKSQYLQKKSKGPKYDNELWKSRMKDD